MREPNGTSSPLGGKVLPDRRFPVTIGYAGLLGSLFRCTMERDVNCRDCRFWLPLVKVRQVESDSERRRIAVKGECRRYAPSPAALTTTWMSVKPGEWCGDFQPVDA